MFLKDFFGTRSGEVTLSDLLGKHGLLASPFKTTLKWLLPMKYKTKNHTTNFVRHLFSLKENFCVSNFEISHKSKLNYEICTVAFFYNCGENFYTTPWKYKMWFHLWSYFGRGQPWSFSIFESSLQTANTKCCTLRKCGMLREYNPRDYATWVL